MIRNMVLCLAISVVVHSVPTAPTVEGTAIYELVLNAGIKFDKNLIVLLQENQSVELRCIANPDEFNLTTLMFTPPKDASVDIKTMYGGSMKSIVINPAEQSGNQGEYDCTARTKKGEFRARLFVVKVKTEQSENCTVQCHNNGACAVDAHGHQYCKCGLGWSGKFCDHSDYTDSVVQGLNTKWFVVLLIITFLLMASIAFAIFLCRKVRKHQKKIETQESVIAEHKSLIKTQSSVIEERELTIKRCNTLMRQKKVSIPEDLVRRLSFDPAEVYSVNKDQIPDRPPLLNGNSKPRYNGTARNTEETVPLKTFLV
ncbi:hypothetical protein L596_005975 [Steinernema carpocapsae]|uniref:EGF-like domain-containing protein n=2 Tax=Steinernema carpocapsae TaxID=34508 RepID=A0A4U8V206_STECR|nr:hypothetical protein L596_005975 [Steinernema carpocapsae]